MSDQLTWIEPRVRRFRVLCLCGSIIAFECQDEQTMRERFHCDRCGNRDTERLSWHADPSKPASMSAREGRCEEESCPTCRLLDLEREYLLACIDEKLNAFANKIDTERRFERIEQRLRLNEPAQPPRER